MEHAPAEHVNDRPAKPGNPDETRTSFMASMPPGLRPPSSRGSEEPPSESDPMPLLPNSASAVIRAACRRNGATAAVALAAFALLWCGCSPTPTRVMALAPPVSGAPESGDPALALDPANGDVLLAWLAGDGAGWRVWFSRSHDHGATWSAPVPVSPPDEPLALRPESSPVLLCDEHRRVGLAWSTAVEIAGRPEPASDLRFARSLDGGKSWGAPVTVNDDATSGPGDHAWEDAEMLPNGALFAAWLDGRPGGERLDADESEGLDASIHVARSDDFGASWGKNVAEWSRVCTSCRIALAADAFGRPVVAFRRHYPGQVRDVVLGRPDTPPIHAFADQWSTSESPGSGPALEFSRDATLRLAWFTGAPGREGVWFRQTLPEQLDSASTPLVVLRGEHLPIVHVDLGEAGMAGTLIACDADSTGDRRLTLVRIEASGRRVVERIVVAATDGASTPRVAASPTSRQAYVAWTTLEGGRSQLKLLRWDPGR